MDHQSFAAPLRCSTKQAPKHGPVPRPSPVASQVVHHGRSHVIHHSDLVAKNALEKGSFRPVRQLSALGTSKFGDQLSGQFGIRPIIALSHHPTYPNIRSSSIWSSLFIVCTFLGGQSLEPSNTVRDRDEMSGREMSPMTERVKEKVCLFFPPWCFHIVLIYKLSIHICVSKSRMPEYRPSIVLIQVDARFIYLALRFLIVLARALSGPNIHSLKMWVSSECLHFSMFLQMGHCPSAPLKGSRIMFLHSKLCMENLQSLQIQLEPSKCN